MRDDEQAQSFHMEVRSTDKHTCQVFKAILVYSLYPDHNKALTKWINSETQNMIPSCMNSVTKLGA